MSARLAREDVFDTEAFEVAATNSVAEALAVFRTALRDGRERLKRCYLENPRHASHIVALQASLTDELLVRAWEYHAGLAPARLPMALVAVGGYGRGELHPASDVDILILVKKLTPKTGPFIEAFVRFLWDMGLEIGHSVRTVKECVQEAKNDLTVATNLMETRLLAGDSALFRKMRKLTGPRKIWPSAKFFAGKRKEQQERHLRFDDTAYNLEPNIKEGPGGLRDIQMISWVTQRHFNTQSLHELVEQGFLSELEYRTLVRGRELLWQIRCGLHHLAGRREERLLFDHQRALAKLFGYRDRPGALAVELFMKRYYRTIKDLSLLNEILLQHFDEAILARGRPKIVPLNRRFQSHNGFLEVRNNRVFERHPFAMIELFHLMQLHP
ncbi:MAG: DUF294 nucleotidyltransferase-like domain-containing protein, partial [Sulfurifustis sp.]